MSKTENTECPNGRTWKGHTRKHHVYIDVSRTRLPKNDPRGDYHVSQKCKFCGKVREYDCIYI